MLNAWLSGHREVTPNRKKVGPKRHTFAEDIGTFVRYAHLSFKRQAANSAFYTYH